MKTYKASCSVVAKVALVVCLVSFSAVAQKGNNAVFGSSSSLSASTAWIDASAFCKTAGGSANCGVSTGSTRTDVYRGQDVIHYLNPSTGLNVTADPLGRFVGGWTLGPDQLKSVQSTGRLY